MPIVERIFKQFSVGLKGLQRHAMRWNKRGKHDDFPAADKWLIYDPFDIITELLQR